MKKEFKRIGTHDGRFHADEVMATAILKEIFEVELIRTRDSAVLDMVEIVYDVGGGQFDHHGAEKIYREDSIPYASSGI
ncbi:MYG1 family protein [Candidatus Clostridium radicumherbarum]|uniref:MYG1 family protein n=1 Tax=Candidatus Clostridium radicumherbarum TaxID=3381662 RepID=A0ABW8TP68_9CLOT